MSGDDADPAVRSEVASGRHGAPRRSDARSIVLHLRFPFVFVLSPLFVWGARMAAGPWTAETTLAFVAVHLALYPGANAYNSVWDEDEGPIGGLARPPPTPEGLEPVAILLQAVGAMVAVLVGFGFAAVYLALWVVFTAYSHPRTRWKASPIGSTVAIVAGQGGLGFALGWSAAGGSWPPGATAVLGLAVALAVVGGLYPWTQVYQVAADAARGERTLASILGARGTAVWTAIGFAAGAALLVFLQELVLAAWSVLAAAGFAILVGRGSRALDHRVVMAILYVNSGALLAMLLAAPRA